MVSSRASGATDEIPHDLAEAERTVDRHHELERELDGAAGVALTADGARGWTLLSSRDDCTRPPTDAAGVL
jgi:hypothetical protein